MARFTATVWILSFILSVLASKDVPDTHKKADLQTTTLTNSTNGGAVQRVTVQDGDSYTMVCRDPNATPAPDARRRRETKKKPKMIYGIILEEAKYVGSGPCRESSIVKNLKKNYCAGWRQKTCEVTAKDPVKECSKRPLKLVFSCGMTPAVMGVRGMIVNNMLDD
ncbi:uncharacterized protein LOC129595367 [Paramacrobiotus metropolitanus]|uniref:uncharacterized protein LOC129595367 n=1 Tax=Paramacrobiotus metropolitanus TaxID=2943436 RepID=UPI00244599F6|nr:uncharacterized protein LOC129595367 [Paramacrobiotus metropolitanus]XP_055348330.1 uncharacterized protein LOC129595367 [Paramacrobiotus metropolitanus]